MSSSTDDLVQKFSVPHSRYESLESDFRMFQGTKEALLAIGDSVEYPTEEWSREQVVEWWTKMGPIFASVMEQWTVPVSDDIASTVAKTDLDYEGVPLRILQKKVDYSSSADLPVVVYLHGGGFTAWSFKDAAYDAYLTRLAALGQCTIVAVDFTPASEKPFPSGLNECFDVVKAVTEGNIDGIPSGKVMIAGDSAGANLAVGVTLKAKESGWMDKIAGLYLVCPYCDGVTKSPEYPSTMEFDGYFASKGFLIAVTSNVCSEEDKDTYFASPLLWPMRASTEELTDFPPVRTIVMQMDMIRDTGIAFHYKLLQANVDSSLSIVSGGVHEQQLFTEHSPQVTDESIHDLARFANYCTKTE